MQPYNLIRWCTFAGTLVSAASITPAAAALSFTLTAKPVVHEFHAGETIIIPGDPPFEFHSNPQVTDSVTFNSSAVSLGAGGATSFEIILAAPAGSHFTIDPGTTQWQFGFTLAFSEEALDAIYTNLDVMFLDISSGIAPELAVAGPGGRWGKTSLGGTAVEPLTGPFAFTGLRIAGDFTPAVGPVTLDSASFSFITRYLVADADPGTSFAIVPIPESAPVLFGLPAIALFFMRRRRRGR